MFSLKRYIIQFLTFKGIHQIISSIATFENNNLELQGQGQNSVFFTQKHFGMHPSQIY